MARGSHHIGNVDLVQSQQLQDNVGLNGLQLATCSEARDLRVVVREHTHTKKCNVAPEPCASGSGPLKASLTSHTTAVLIPQLCLSPTYNKNEAPGPWKVYSRGRWCRKPKAPIKADMNEKMVNDCWSQTQQRGWGGFALKEKIKHLKERLKLWNKEQFGDTFKRVQNIEAELNKLKNDTVDRQLTPRENMKRKMLSHESLMRQKARSTWIKEGDCNSRYFHLLLNSNRRYNAVNGVFIDGSWVDEPLKVKEEVHRFFQQRFQDPMQSRPKLNGISFNSIGKQENHSQVGRFNEEEIKRAVWECGSEKSPGPDGLNFKFIKQF